MNEKSAAPSSPSQENLDLTIQWIDENWETRAKPAIIKVLNRRMKIPTDLAEDMASDLVVKLLESGSIGPWLAAGNTVSPWELANWAYQDLRDNLEKQAQDGARRALNPVLRTRSEQRSVEEGGPSARPVHIAADPFSEHSVRDEDDSVVFSEYAAPNQSDPESILILKEMEEGFQQAILDGFPQAPERMQELYAHLREEKVRSEIAPELGVSKDRCATLVQNLRWCLRHGPEGMRILRKKYKQ